MATMRHKANALFLRGAPTAQIGVETLLLPFFRNNLPTVRQILPSVRKRMTDEQIIQHVRILLEDQWPELGINYTLVSRPSPLPHASELVAMKNTLVELGLSPREAILFLVAKGRDIPVESIEVLKKKLQITFNNHRLRGTPTSKYSITCLATLLKTPIERLETIQRRMQEEGVDAEHWVPMLFRYIRERPKGKIKPA